jgi:xanthine dehydrogenase accessory factor
MLVTTDRLNDTIGGGHLELRAVEIARAMLHDGRQRHLERFALGPGLGQCCGGVVHLAFELAESATCALLAARCDDDTVRMVALDGAPDIALFGQSDEQLSGTATPVFSRQRGTHVMQEQDGRRWLVDPVCAPRTRLFLFGAGHVGAAIVRALAPMPCMVNWVDERDEMFPVDVPSNVRVEATDTPEALVVSAPAGASFLVMTHSHALDQRLTETILGRDDVLWFGLIGSHTKRKQFEHRLRARGVPEARIEAMVCPIGLPGITDKAPAVIAASVCAQLLGVWEGARQAASAATPLKLVQNSY